MKKFFKRFVYINFIIFHCSFIILGNSDNVTFFENKDLSYKISLSDPEISSPSTQETPTILAIHKRHHKKFIATPKKPIIPKKLVAPKTPQKKVPVPPKKPITPKTPPKKAPVTSGKPTTPLQSDIGRLALQYTNEFRAQNKLKPLKWNQKLADLSTEHSKNMAEGKVKFGHDGFQNRVSRFPGRYRSAAENVFMTSSGHAVARDAVNGWIGSPGHRKNLLSNSTDCGIGVYKGQRYWYVTQMFAHF